MLIDISRLCKKLHPPICFQSTLRTIRRLTFKDVTQISLIIRKSQYLKREFFNKCVGVSLLAFKTILFGK